MNELFPHLLRLSTLSHPVWVHSGMETGEFLMKLVIVTDLNWPYNTISKFIQIVRNWSCNAEDHRTIRLRKVYAQRSSGKCLKSTASFDSLFPVQNGGKQPAFRMCIVDYSQIGTHSSIIQSRCAAILGRKLGIWQLPFPQCFPDLGLDIALWTHFLLGSGLRTFRMTEHLAVRFALI